MVIRRKGNFIHGKYAVFFSFQQLQNGHYCSFFLCPLARIPDQIRPWSLESKKNKKNKSRREGRESLAIVPASNCACLHDKILKIGLHFQHEIVLCLTRKYEQNTFAQKTKNLNLARIFVHIGV